MTLGKKRSATFLPCVKNVAEMCVTLVPTYLSLAHSGLSSIT
jgi:hypothetical protein